MTEAPESSNGLPIRILLIDGDSDDRLHAAVAMRKELGIVVSTSVGSRPELDAALEGPEPDAVVTEFAPSWIAGPEVIGVVRARWPTVPVVLFSASADDEMVESAIAAGVDDYVLDNAPGRYARLGAVVRAAMNRRADRRAASDVQSRYRTLFDGVPVGLFRKTPAGQIFEANPAWLSMFGYRDLESLRRFHASEIYVHPDDRARYREAMDKDGAVVGFEFEARRADCSTFWVRSSARVIRDAAGTVVFHDGVVEDVTARRRAEDELRRTQEKLLLAQRLEAVGRLASGVAHDFNNLLTAINGYAELARRDMVRASPAFAYVEEIRESADRASSLTRQLLAFSRDQVLRPKVIDVNDVVREMYRLLRRIIGEDVELSLSLEPDLAPVSADVGQIEQVVVNLAANARDAMPHGGQLTIKTANVELDADDARTHPGLSPGPHVLITFADTGVGMDDATLRHVFEPFFTTKPRGRGTGLGLATALGIVEQSHGRIEVSSRLGRGTTFRIYLPRAAEPLERARLDDASTPPPPAGHETVLVVEDDDRLRFIVRRILEDAGYGVLVARGAADVPVMLREMSAAPDLIVSDVVMRNGSGPQVVADLAAAGTTARVLYMSGYEDATLVRRGLIQAGTPYLAKPFTADTLLRAVRDVLDGPRVK